jgi:hypothetical protein
VVRRLLFAVGLGALGAGCPASHDAYPQATCNVPADCFRGEMCVAHACVPSGGGDAAAQDLAAPLDLAGDAE